MMVGPTKIPRRVLDAMNKQAISHRSEEYRQVQERVTSNMKKIFGTNNQVLVLTSSGTGAMESVIQNCFSPNDEVVVPVVGNFSRLYAEIAEIYGLNVKRINFENGETADIEKVMANVNKNTKGVLLVHNESSTGVFNDVKGFGKALKNTNAILIVDSVSGAGGLEMRMDKWNVDVVLTSSQKALMSPPGLAFVSLSEKAWERVKYSAYPKYYFDFKRASEFNKKNETLTTPSTHVLFAVDEALKMILEEGLDNVYQRHIDNTRLLIEGVKRLGYRLLAKDERFASPSLTAIRAPGYANYMVKELKERNVIVNPGIGELKNDVFRVGVMGYVSKDDILIFLSALEEIEMPNFVESS